MLHLDAIDRKILRVLQRDGGMSQAALAEQVGSSPASCWRRTRAMEEAGVFGPLVRLVDPAKVGKPLVVICQIRMKAHDPRTRSDFESFVQGLEEILECYSMSGDWDYLLRVVSGDVEDYERVLMRAILTHPSVAASSTHFAMKQIKYSTAIPV